MDINIDLERDTDNTNCDDLKISFYEGESTVTIELDKPGRSLCVSKEDFIKMCEYFAFTSPGRVLCVG